LVSGSVRAETELGWRPTRSTLQQMITDAWRWHQTGHYSA
ncbi:MAG TPA: UDP-glucose 4-epimerase GalE, partial [Sulfitobacter sp.]|nr:UDP-glucose 4-epimerase GalE [Sulfitobacter sp.]